MSGRVLFVDDEPNVLSAFKRHLYRRFEMETALGPAEGLRAIEGAASPFAVIVADMRMPGMDGIEFLRRARAMSPHSVRVMLTGNPDQQTVVAAVNDGAVFRFLNKPCTTDQLAQTLTDAIRQYELVTAERELLERTLSGAVRLVTELMGLVDPEAHQRGALLREMARQLAAPLEVEKPWELELAAMLAPVCWMVVPREVREKHLQGRPLTAAEEEVLTQSPEAAKRLLMLIPRLEGVSQILLYQNKRFDGGGFPADVVAGEAIPMAARVLKPLLDLLELRARGLGAAEAMDRLRGRAGWYDPQVIAAMLPTLVVPELGEPVVKKLKELRPGLVLAQDVRTREGTLLVREGQVISPSLLSALRNYHCLGRVADSIQVVEPPPRGAWGKQ